MGKLGFRQGAIVRAHIIHLDRAIRIKLSVAFEVEHISGH